MQFGKVQLAKSNHALGAVFRFNTQAGRTGKSTHWQTFASRRILTLTASAGWITLLASVDKMEEQSSETHLYGREVPLQTRD